tara:strand:- start:1311 stop:1469 length:159 start_codon:yes stop_codon:yes gene_type:complete
LKKTVVKLPIDAIEIIRHSGDIFYEANGVIYKKSMDFQKEDITIVSKANSTH